MVTRESPKFTGVSTYRDPLGRFSIRYPSDWHHFDLDEDREGTMYLPVLTDEQTYFSTWISQMPESVVAEDLPVLKEGVAAGLAQLPDLAVEESSDIVLGDLLKFIRIYTFNEQGTTRKRKVWIFYADVYVIVVTYQGSSPVEYDYWLAMVNYCFEFFQLPEALWFAVDRDLKAERAAAAVAEQQ